MTIWRAVLLLSALAAAPSARAAAQLRPPCGDTVPARAIGLAPALAAAGVVVDSTPAPVRICGIAGHFAAAAFVPPLDTVEQYGPRVFVRRTRPRGAEVVYASPRMMDTNLPTLAVFPAEGRALLVADVGNEGSWGLAMYEVVAGRARELAELDVGLPAAGGTGDPDESALEHARAGRVGGRWVVRFDTTVVLHPNQDQERGRRVVPAEAGGVTFRFVGDVWRRER